MLRNRLLDLIRSRFGSDVPPLRLVFPNDDVFNFVPNPPSRSPFVRRRPVKAMLKGDFTVGRASALLQGVIQR